MTSPHRRSLCHEEDQEHGCDDAHRDDPLPGTGHRAAGRHGDPLHLRRVERQIAASEDDPADHEPYERSQYEAVGDVHVGQHAGDP